MIESQLLFKLSVLPLFIYSTMLSTYVTYSKVNIYNKGTEF